MGGRSGISLCHGMRLYNPDKIEAASPIPNYPMPLAVCITVTDKAEVFAYVA